MSSGTRFSALCCALVALACSDGPSPTGPVEPAEPAAAPTVHLDAGALCDGAALPAAECEALVTLYNTTDARPMGPTGAGIPTGTPSRTPASGPA